MIMAKFELCLYVWISILATSCFYTANLQELGHFNKSSEIDFEKNKIWAEIKPKASTTTTSMSRSGSPTSVGDTTPDPSVGANAKEVKEKTISWENPTARKVIDVGYTTTQGGGGGEEEGEGDGGAGTTTRRRTIFREITSRDHGENTPPYIKSPVSSKRQIIPPVGSKKFQCEADGNPTPIYTWYRNGERLDADGVNTKAFQNGTLYFENFSERRGGEFHCKAVNAHGTAVSVRFPVVEELRPLEKAQSDKPVVTVRKWEQLSMECGETPPTIPEYAKRWYDESSTEYYINTRIGKDSQGTLHFAYTELSDAAEYTCGLANKRGITFFNKRKLVVEDASDTGDSAPNEEFVPSKVKAVLGLDFVLECFFSGKPIPTISWKNSSNHDILPGNPLYEVFDFGRKLKIKKVRQEDEGTFKCTARNNVAMKEGDIFVNVTTPPLRTYGSLSTYTKPDQEDFTLTCQARAAAGERLEPPVWYRNGEKITLANLPDPSRYSFSEDFTGLTIKKLVKTVDTASYQCNVKNSEGDLYMNGYLRVINSIQISSQPNGTIKLSANSTNAYDISVRATGDNCCRIDVLYYFNNSQLSDNTLHTPPFRKNDSAGMVIFDPSSVSKDALEDWLGDYTVRVSDAHQEKYVKFTVVSGETTPQPIVAVKGGAGGTGLWWIGIVCGVLAILIVIVIVIIVYKSNYPGETYQLEKTELKHDLNPEQDLLDQSFQEI